MELPDVFVSLSPREQLTSEDLVGDLAALDVPVPGQVHIPHAARRDVTDDLES
jgi:hypothetical protein